MFSVSRMLLAGACALSLSSAAVAAPHRNSTQAQALLDKAVAELQAAGPAKAFAEFNEAKGSFKDGDLYVFVFSLKGVYEATGADPKLVGTEAIDMTDAEGKPLVRAMIEATKDGAPGKVDYVWLNRVDNRVEHKRSLVKRVGDHIVGVGYYAG